MHLETHNMSYALPKRDDCASSEYVDINVECEKEQDPVNDILAVLLICGNVETDVQISVAGELAHSALLGKAVAQPLDHVRQCRPRQTLQSRNSIVSSTVLQSRFFAGTDLWL